MKDKMKNISDSNEYGKTEIGLKKDKKSSHSLTFIA